MHFVLFDKLNCMAHVPKTSGDSSNRLITSLAVVKFSIAAIRKRTNRILGIHCCNKLPKVILAILHQNSSSYKLDKKINLKSFTYSFYLYIYPPDSHESNGGAIHRVSNYPDLLPEIPRYCSPLVI